MKRFLVLTGVLVLAVLLYVVLAKGHGPALLAPGSLPPPPAHDWAAEREGLAADLQAYLRLQTVRGNERVAAEFLQKLLEKEGIPSRLLDVKDHPERASLLAELPGTRADGGIILGGHTDVVEANAAEWSHPPFEGTRVGDRLFGRGAVDMKGMGLMELRAFVALKRAGIPLPRKVMYLAMPDEESGGGKGALELLATQRPLFAGYEYMLQEGGIGTNGVVAPGATLFNLQYAEKGVLWVRAKATGPSGHGSMPPPRYATSDLLAFLDDVRDLEHGLTITPEMEQFLFQVGLASPQPKAFFLQRSGNPLVALLLGSAIAASKPLHAMTTNTRSFTGLVTEHTGVNVITDAAEATIDVRLLPGVSPDAYLAKLKAIGEPRGVTLEVIHSHPATQSPLDDVFFRTLAGVATRAVPEAIVAPFMSPGGTDSNGFRGAGLKCYGLIPAVLTQEDIDGIHGKNESITVDNLTLGARIIFEALAAMER